MTTEPSLSVIHSALASVDPEARWNTVKAHLAQRGVHLTAMRLHGIVRARHVAGEWTDVPAPLVARLKAFGMYEANPALAAEAEAAAEGYVPRRRFIEITGVSERTAPDYAVRYGIRTKDYNDRTFYHEEDATKHGFGPLTKEMLEAFHDVVIGCPNTIAQCDVIVRLAARGVHVSPHEATRIIDRMHRAGHWDDIPMAVYKTLSTPLTSGTQPSLRANAKRDDKPAAPCTTGDCEVPLEEAKELLGRSRSSVLWLAAKHNVRHVIQQQKYFFSRADLEAMAKKIGPNRRDRDAGTAWKTEPASAASPAPAATTAAVPASPATPAAAPAVASTATAPAKPVAPALVLAPAPAPTPAAPGLEELLQIGMRSVDAGLLTRDELLNKLVGRISARMEQQ